MPSFRSQVWAVRLINPSEVNATYESVWKGTLRLRAYNESLLQQIGNRDHHWLFLEYAVLPLITADLICMFCV